MGMLLLKVIRGRGKGGGEERDRKKEGRYDIV
jgi:hypothetical protein